MALRKASQTTSTFFCPETGRVWTGLPSSRGYMLLVVSSSLGIKKQISLQIVRVKYLLKWAVVFLIWKSTPADLKSLTWAQWGRGWCGLWSGVVWWRSRCSPGKPVGADEHWNTTSQKHTWRQNTHWHTIYWLKLDFLSCFILRQFNKHDFKTISLLSRKSINYLYGPLTYSHMGKFKDAMSQNYITYN